MASSLDHFPSAPMTVHRTLSVWKEKQRWKIQSFFFVPLSEDDADFVDDNNVSPIERQISSYHLPVVTPHTQVDQMCHCHSVTHSGIKTYAHPS